MFRISAGKCLVKEKVEEVLVAVVGQEAEKAEAEKRLVVGSEPEKAEAERMVAMVVLPLDEKEAFE